MNKKAAERFNQFYMSLTSYTFPGNGKWNAGLAANSHIFFHMIAISLVLYGLYRWLYLPFVQDFLLAEKCRFRLENPEPLKVGDSVIYTISGFLPTLDMDHEELEAYTSRFFKHLTAKVTMNGERIPAMKAYAEEEAGKIKMIFTVEKSGTYFVEVRYCNFVIPGAPGEFTVPPDMMSAGDSDIKLPSVPVLLTDGMPQTIEIYPKDRTGYPCSFEGVRLDKFDFHASSVQPCCNPSACGKTLEFVGGYWKEGLDATFTYEGSPYASEQSFQSVAVLLNLRTNKSPNSYGIFEGQVCYDGHIVKNGCFPIIALTCDEYERLEPTLREPRPSDVIQLRAEILQPAPSLQMADAAATSCESEKKSFLQRNDPKSFIEWYMLPKGITEISGYTTKEVHVNVSMKFICIKEVVWTVLLSRTALFPIHGSTKIVVVPETEEKLRYLVTISDESPNEIRLLMSASNTRMLMALYLKFRSNTFGSSMTYHEKSDIFFDNLKRNCSKQMAFEKDDIQTLNVSRPDIMRTTYEETMNFEKVNWYNPFTVCFLGESALDDASSAWLEWSELFLETVFENNPLGMFHKISEKSGFVHPNPSRNHRRWCIQYYELAGKVVGKYLVERCLKKTADYRVKARLSRSFLQQLIGSQPTTMERDMPELYETTIMTLKKSTLQEDAMLSFCVPYYDIYGKLDQMIPIIDDGEQIAVTNENAEQYLNALARYHLSHKVQREIEAFRAGFTTLIPEDLLLNFDENELELLLCGWSKVDVSDIKHNHTAIGEHWHPEFPRILKWFWTSVGSMTAVDGAKFLQFCTGSSVLPVGGFAYLRPRLTLSMTCLYGQPPVADPCSHCVCFSDHPSYDAFHTAFLTAIRTSACCQDRPKQCKHGSLQEIISSNNVINNNNFLNSDSPEECP